ncbi:isocitrate lyase/phosphoenolpyruvate mutase family protein [Pseudomonas putida]|uniref:isocitrate lyase/PEP mutase family protein n=1 Tax=Pseudomonas TaxID=286 RepID=UPI0007611C8F|nr:MULTISPECIES: isocitrate lyase/phosphoenolpyruvate mutase family protein [Pseudomonas]EKT4448928.1 isocitrate lyase/phosphoenolpyruvate mutase family protein [Pseudomonas putida]MDD2068113.1 isocitrate lyase/phosphoenolpyruvate mutase family protein [Pseudomonas putida]HDS1740423.1 isocitrate lyase/phosphoenolpyruvate mutase family protein [Pseudomonas putida]
MNERSHSELRIAFRALLQGTSCKFAASVFDPLSVRMAADIGFETAILGGSVASLQVLGAPDITLITLDEFTEQASRLGRASQIPIIADADHGYGNALNVMRTVTELQKAGVAALTLEDTHLPASYNQAPMRLISLDEASCKIYAARVARSDETLSIIARTHVGVTTLSDSVARTTAYQTAGADAICLVGVNDFKHLAQLTAHLSVPIMLINYANPELADTDKLAAANVRIVVNGHKPYFSAVQATYEALCAERQGEHPTLTASQLVAKYSQSDTYQRLAETYLQAGSSFN